MKHGFKSSHYAHRHFLFWRSDWMRKPAASGVGCGQSAIPPKGKSGSDFAHMWIQRSGLPGRAERSEYSQCLAGEQTRGKGRRPTAFRDDYTVINVKRKKEMSL